MYIKQCRSEFRLQFPVLYCSHDIQKFFIVNNQLFVLQTRDLHNYTMEEFYIWKIEGLHEVNLVNFVICA